MARAYTLDAVSVPNAKYLAHLAHQTPKKLFIHSLWLMLLMVMRERRQYIILIYSKYYFNV